MIKKSFTVLLLLLTSAQFAAAAERFLRVSADAEVRVPPNRVTITLGVTRQTQDLSAGVKALQKDAAGLLSYCRTWNVKEKNLQTENVRIAPVYPAYAAYASNKNAASAKPQYRLSQTVSVTLEDPSQYENIMYGLLKNGANRIESVRFYSSQMRKYRDEARRLAMRHAKEKAQLLAREAGVKLGKVLSVTEDPQPSFYGPANLAQNAYSSAASGESGAPATGLISVRADVTVQYQIK